jgi:hypothetical protein
MIETRPLNRVEILEVLNNAPDSETRNLKLYLDKYGFNAYEFLNINSVYKYGLIINGRPIYFAYVHKRNKDGYELWTVVNSDVKEQKSLFKYSKINLMNALKEFSPIYATMETENIKNIRWVIRLGFKKIFKDDKNIIFKIEKE